MKILVNVKDYVALSFPVLYVTVAQQVEHQTENLGRVGSIPTCDTNPASDGRYKKSLEKTPQAACRGLGN